MPWYFYDKGGKLATPKPVGELAPGTIVMSPIPYTSSEPDGYLFCNGQAVLKDDYNALYFQIGGIYGETFGVGATFNVPDMQGRFPRGIVNSSSGIGSGSGVGGSKTHSHSFAAHDHTVSHLAHNHTIDSHTHAMTHKHELASHRHDGENYTLSSSNKNSSAQTTAVPAEYQDSARGNHDHNGLTGNTASKSSTVLSGASSSSNTAPQSDSLSTTHISAASSGNSVAEVSSAVTQLPPFLTVSFLIKT